MRVKKGSLVQKRQHKHGRGGTYIEAKLVVCLGQEITLSFKSPMLKVRQLTLRKRKRWDAFVSTLLEMFDPFL